VLFSDGLLAEAVAVTNEKQDKTVDLAEVVGPDHLTV
jgi:hypothetical protein